jgi:hydroxymethylbilane synthase
VAEGRFRLGTRGSALALAQAEVVRTALRQAHPGLVVETEVIRTSGDRPGSAPLGPAGLKGLFVKEIEEALLAGRIDAAVHSMKDLPARLAPGLMLAAVPPRAAAHDVLVWRGTGGLAALPPGLRLGTSSVRRRAQLLAHRPDLRVVAIRGNVDTRLRRWRDGEVDALVLAAAGLERLGVPLPEAAPLAPEEFVPAVGQGALALECRVDDDATRARLAPLDHAPTATAVTAERSFLLAVGGDCNTPLGAHAAFRDRELALRALLTDADGRHAVGDTATGAAEDAAGLGRRLAERLLAAGGAAVVRR